MDHEVRLVVGEDDGAVTPPCPLDVRPGLEAREASPVELDDLVARVRPRRRARAQPHEPDRARVGRLPPERAPDRAGPPLLLPDAGQVDARRRGLPPADDARGLRFLLRGPGLLPRGPRAHGAAPRSRPDDCRSPCSRATCGRSSWRPGRPPRRVHVVPPFVHRLDPGAAPSGPPCVLFVGRLVEAKGVRDAVAAWRRSGVDLPLVMAGTGPLRAELTAQAGRGEGPELEVPGWVERDRLSGLYRRARALLLPSRWQEPFGIVGLEALSFGVPVVAWESGRRRGVAPGAGPRPLGRRGGAGSRPRRRREPARHASRPRFERDETIGRLLAIYARLSTSS